MIGWQYNLGWMKVNNNLHDRFLLMADYIKQNLNIFKIDKLFF